MTDHVKLLQVLDAALAAFARNGCDHPILRDHLAELADLRNVHKARGPKGPRLHANNDPAVREATIAQAKLQAGVGIPHETPAEDELVMREEGLDPDVPSVEDFLPGGTD